MSTSQDLSLVRHFWRCFSASTCTAQRSPGCRTVCVCDKHTVNKAGKRVGSGATTDPAFPSTHTFLLNLAVRHTSLKGGSCRFANCEGSLAEGKTTAKKGLKTRLGWAGLQRSASWDFFSPNHQHSEHVYSPRPVLTSAVFPACLIWPAASCSH